MPSKDSPQTPSPTTPTRRQYHSELASPSQINAIIQCEGIYYSRYIAKDPRLPTGDKLVIGATIDNMLSDWFTNKLTALTPVEIEHYFKIERHRSSDTGAKWMMEEKWSYLRRQDLWLKISDLLNEYVEQVKLSEWTTVTVQQHVEGVIEGQKFHGYIDWMYQDKDGKNHIVDWKVKQRKDRLDFTHRVQLSIYAYLLGVWNIEAHYLVPYTKKPGWIIHRDKPLDLEIIKHFIKQRDRINRPPGDLVLNPLSRLCSPNWCPAWHGCIAGGRRSS